MLRRAHDERVTELTRQRLAALTRELGLPDPEPVPEREMAPQPDGAASAHPATAAPREKRGRHAAPRRRRHRRLTAWVADRLPLALRIDLRPQHGLSAVHVGLVCLVLATGLAVTVWWVVRAGAAGSPVPERPVAVAPSVVADTSGAAAAGPSAGASPSSESSIVVDVIGKVRKPGIAVLPVGSRVVDAVRASGGLRPGVSRRTVNLARLLVDGEQLLVGVAAAGTPGAGAAVGPEASSEPLVNINTADQAELETLPGVGPVTATAILDWRAEHGAFTAVEELMEVSGIGEATLADLRPLVTL